jgi:hypothetical protein
MFDWFKSKIYKTPKYPTWSDVPDLNKVYDDMKKVGDDIKKVIPFPEPYKVDVKPPEPPKEEPAGKTVYSVGLTDDSRVSLHVGYSSIIMNPAGVQQLIEQLQLFKSQIEQVTADD